jgi:hypothetical protein
MGISELLVATPLLEVLSLRSVLAPEEVEQSALAQRDQTLPIRLAPCLSAARAGVAEL